MAERAKITSVEALDAFRAHLIVYQSKARPALEEISSDIGRLRRWLQDEQRLRWEHEVKKRRKVLEEAQAALFSARLSVIQEVTTTQQFTVSKAKRACDAAEEKLKCVKQWSRKFDTLVEPLLRQMEGLHTVLANDLPKAIALLANTVRTLSDYADLNRPLGAANPNPNPDTDTDANPSSESNAEGSDTLSTGASVSEGVSEDSSDIEPASSDQNGSSSSMEASANPPKP